jgi:NADPH:quinone reductase-like Zn-dependent oxidoreductase
MEGDEMAAIAMSAAADDRVATMRAAVRERWGAPPDVVEIKQVPKPGIGDDQVLVRVRAVSINRSDYYSLAAPGLLLRPMIGGFLRPKTHAIGGDFAGVVEAVGKDMTDFAPGDEVFGSRTGAFAEYVAARMIAHKPKTVTFEQAAAVSGSALTALQALRDHGRLQPGGSVLINGASGAVGTFAVQIAKALGGGRVTAVCSTRNVEQARELRADRVIDYTKEDFTKSGETYDVVIDIGGNKPWRKIRRVLQPKGSLVIVGSQKKGNRLIGPLGHVFRTWLASRFGSQRAVFFIAKFNRPDMEVLRELLASNKIKPVIERVYPFARIVDALQYMGEGHARAKLVVTID